MHHHHWPHPQDVHKCHVHGCEDIGVGGGANGGGGRGGGGGGGRGNGDNREFELSSQIEREWETTLRNTFGVVLGEGGGREMDEKRDDGGELLSRRISASTARARSEPGEQQQQQHQQQLKPSFEDLGHPGERVLGLFTIASGDGSRVRNSVEETGTESSSYAALWSSSWEPQRRTPPVPERSYLR